MLSRETPLALVGRDGRRRVVLHADAAAQRLGIVPGLAATQARALVAELAVEDADPAGDSEGLERLALWTMKRYSPLVSTDADGLYLDATGVPHLYGGEPAMLADLLGRCEEVGVAARVAMAPTYGAAHALARYGAERVAILDDAIPPALERLPIAALRLAPDQIDGLRRLGFDTIGELAASPRAPLALRFGSEPGRRLDQAFGRQSEPVIPVIPEDLISVRRAFAEPIAASDVLVRHLGQLAEALCAALDAKRLGARHVDVYCHRVDHRVEAVRIKFAKPARDAKRLMRLLGDKLEQVDPGFGMETLILAASWVEPLVPEQSITTLGEKTRPDLASLVDALTNRLGPDHLYRAVAVESDVPERCVGHAGPIGKPTATSWPAHWPRPTRLLTRPEPIETIALLPDQPPVSFTWRGVRRRVARADGPERIFGEWWVRDAEQAAVRDYFQLEDEQGERFWVYRAGDGVQPSTGSHRWFLHGVFA